MKLIEVLADKNKLWVKYLNIRSFVQMYIIGK